jgi:K+-sensing histidine kinase KdpD
MLIM